MGLKEHRERIAALRATMGSGAGPWQAAPGGIRYRRIGEEQVMGTGAVGGITARYQDLVRALGEPNRPETMDGKVSTEWVLQVGTEVVTVYDYKEWDEQGHNKHPAGIIHWHIGGAGDPQTLVEAIVGILVAKAGLARQDVPHYHDVHSGGGLSFVEAEGTQFKGGRQRAKAPRLSR